MAVFSLCLDGLGSHPPRSQRDRTRREDRHLKFYELRDIFRHGAAKAGAWQRAC
jgi:hypothetical protein